MSVSGPIAGRQLDDSGGCSLPCQTDTQADTQAVMKLLLIRHGETPLNIARVLQPAATPLSERGHAQAAALATRLTSYELAGIVSSDLPRALQTAHPLAQATGLQIQTTALLQERNFGDLRGRAYDSLDLDPMQMHEAPPGGESMPEFERRVAAAFAQVLALQADLGGPLAVVSHGLVVRALLMRHARAADDQAMGIRMHNCSLSIMSATAPYRIELLDCTAHLAADLREPARSLSGG